MALVGWGRSGHTGPPPKKRQKEAPPKQNIALFFHSGTPKVINFFFRNYFVLEH